MVQHLIVPVDGSDASWRAADVAFALARRCDARVDIVEFVGHDDDVADADVRIAGRLSQHDAAGIEVRTAAIATTESVAQGIAAEVRAHPEVVVVMASHGRGRSAALVGSVTEELLRLEFGPVLVVGPRCEPTEFSGPIVAAIDGSRASESALALAVAWGIELHVDPWIVQVIDPDASGGPNASGEPHVDESASAARLARQLARDSGHSVQFEVLHGREPHVEVTTFATTSGASLIVATTHGRTGLSRFASGSTTAAIVHHATCPVLLLRPPHVANTT